MSVYLNVLASPKGDKWNAYIEVVADGIASVVKLPLERASDARDAAVVPGLKAGTIREVSPAARMADLAAQLQKRREFAAAEQAKRDATANGSSPAQPAPAPKRTHLQVREA